MNMPQFTADASLYRTNSRHQLIAAFAAHSGGLVSPAVTKGTHCVVHDPSCASGYSTMYCPSYDPDSCYETGICCTRPPPPPPPPSCPTGEQLCTDGGVYGCCPKGAHCCNDNHGCCPAGQSCRSILGVYFCDPIFGSGGWLGGLFSLAHQRSSSGGTFSAGSQRRISFG
jgi:hypothetical protein